MSTTERRTRPSRPHRSYDVQVWNVDKGEPELTIHAEGAVALADAVDAAHAGMEAMPERDDLLLLTVTPA